MEWKKLILLFIGIVFTFGGLIGFITSLNPIYLYIITVGVIAFVVRHFHDGKRVNVTMKYVEIMGLLLILQFIILFSFIVVINPIDWVIASVLSLNILMDFRRQVDYSDLAPLTIFGFIIFGRRSPYKKFEFWVFVTFLVYFLAFLYIGIAIKFNL